MGQWPFGNRGRSLTQLRASQVRVFLLPDVEGRLTDAWLPAHIGHRRAALHLRQGMGDPLIRISGSLHHPLVLWEGSETTFVQKLCSKSGLSAAAGEAWKRDPLPFSVDARHLTPEPHP